MRGNRNQFTYENLCLHRTTDPKRRTVFNAATHISSLLPSYCFDDLHNMS